MPKQAYLNKRKELQDKAQGLIDEGKAKEAEDVMNEIKALDEAFEAEAKARANLQALNRSAVIDIENAGVSPTVTKFVDKIGTENITDEAEIYKNAFAKTLMNQVLDNKEQEVFDRLSKPLNPVNNGSQVQTTKTDGIVVPDTLQKEIFRVMGGTHPILNDVFNFDVEGELTLLVEKDEQNRNKDLWTDEDDKSNDKKVSNLAKVTLSGCELSRGVTISWKLKKMSIEKFLEYVIESISEEMGDALAYAFIEGKGKAGVDDEFKSQPLGIMTALEAEADKPQIVEYDEDDNLEPLVRKCISKVKGKFASGACMYANHDYIWNTLMGIKDETGRAYFKTDYNSGGIGTIFGAIVKEEDAVPDNTMVFGNVKRCYAYNVNEAMSITQQDDTRTRTTFYSAYMLCDGAPKTTKGFSLLKKSKKA